MIEIIVPEWFTASTLVASVVGLIFGGIFLLIGVMGIKEREWGIALVGWIMSPLVIFALLVIWHIVEFVFE